MICPKCGADMVERSSKKGKFWGCSKFPDCKGIVNITEENKSIPNSNIPKSKVVQQKIFLFNDYGHLDNAVNMFAKDHKTIGWTLQVIPLGPEKFVYVELVTYEG